MIRRIKVALFSVAACAYALSLLVSPTLFAFDELATISGRVIDITRAPLHFAEVKLRREGETSVTRSMTGERSGVFRFDGLVPGTYHVSITVQGFKQGRVSHTISAAEAVELGDILLELGPISGCGGDTWQRPGIKFQKGPKGAELTGKAAQQRGGRPLPLALAMLTGKPGAYRVLAGSDGAFQFLNVNPGLYTLKITREGFADFVLKGVEVRPGLRTAILDQLELPRCPDNVKCQSVSEVRAVHICL